MSLPLITAQDQNDNRQWSQIGAAFVALLIIAVIAGAGGVLSHFVGAPKALFLILTAIVTWSIGGWFLGGWRLVLTGLAALAAALAASHGDYVLSVVLSGLLFLFLSTHIQIQIVPSRH